MLDIISCKCPLNIALLVSHTFWHTGFSVFNFNYFHISIIYYPWLFRSLCVCWFIYIAMCTCMCGCGGQRLPQELFLGSHPFTLLFEILSHWDLGLTHSAKLTDWRASSTCLSAHFHCCDYKYGCHHVCHFTWVLGIEFRSSWSRLCYLHSPLKYFYISNYIESFCLFVCLFIIWGWLSFTGFSCLLNWTLLKVVKILYY